MNIAASRTAAGAEPAMIDTLMFDFDGLILDTETPDFESWRLVYEEYGAELPRDAWVAAIGSDGSAFDPALTSL